MSTLSGPGPSYHGAPPWVNNPTRNHVVERNQVLWVLAPDLLFNAYEIHQILQLSSENQVAARLGELRWWQPDENLPPQFLVAAMLRDGSLHVPQSRQDGIRRSRDFLLHPTQHGQGTVHVIMPAGLQILKNIGWLSPTPRRRRRLVQVL